MRKVLLVEDNPMDIDLAVRAFAGTSIENRLVVARDGEEALACPMLVDETAKAPCLILLDLKLPRMSGLDFLEKVRCGAKPLRAPVVVLTTSDTQCERAAAYELGASSYLVKPLEYSRFLVMARAIAHYWIDLNRLPE